jgi:uncharacterized protein
MFVWPHDGDEEMGINLEAVRQQLAELCRKYGLSELSVFGSVARGDEKPDSDVDLLYVRAPSTVLTYVDLMDLKEELEALLSRSVDLVPKTGLHRLIRDQVLADARVLYAAA